MTNQERLRRTALFRDLDESSIRELDELFVEVRVPAGEYLFQENDPADAFYILCEGALILVRDSVGRPMQLIGRLGEGDYCGVTGLFDVIVRSISAKATQSCRALKIERKAFLEFLDRHPGPALELQMKAAERHRVYAAAALDLGRRAEVRIRIDRPARILSESPPFETRVDNVSSGGLCLTRMPPSWDVGAESNLRLDVAGKVVLHFRGRVAWEHDERVGIAFGEDPSSGDPPKLQIQRLLQELLILK